MNANLQNAIALFINVFTVGLGLFILVKFIEVL